MNESKILELFKTLKTLKGDSQAYSNNQNELFRTILLTPEVQKALQSNTWTRSFKGDVGECESIVNAGILKTIRFFDLKKKGKFSTFLWTMINQEFSRMYKHEFGKKKVFLESIEGISLNGEDAPIEELYRMEDSLDHKFFIEQILRSSTADEQEVLKRLLIGMTYTEISKETKFDNYKIWRICKTIKDKFSERYS